MFESRGSGGRRARISGREAALGGGLLLSLSEAAARLRISELALQVLIAAGKVTLLPAGMVRAREIERLALAPPRRRRRQAAG